MRGKKSLFVLFLVAIIAGSQGVIAQSCLTSSEEYATEVVIPDYTVFNLEQMVSEKNGQFLMPAEYNNQLITIIEEVEFPKGLAVRLQVPTSIVEIKQPHVKFVSSSASGELRDVSIDSFGSWQISCIDDSQCEFEKNQRKIMVRQVGGQPEVTIEITEELAECSETCSGLCFAATTEVKCVESSTQHDFDTILRYFGVADTFEELFDSYRIIGSEEITIVDIKPASNSLINWQEAMRQQLVFLSREDVIDLARDDIESIAALAKKGQAGQNYRAVFDFENEIWTYYDQTENPVLTGQRDCTPYSLVAVESLSPTVQESEENNSFNTFYTIPIIALLAGLFLLVILIIIGRIISNGRSTEHLKEWKPISGSKSDGPRRHSKIRKKS